MSMVTEAYNYVKLSVYNFIQMVYTFINFPIMYEAFKKSAIEFASACSPELRANDWLLEYLYFNLVRLILYLINLFLQVVIWYTSILCTVNIS